MTVDMAPERHTLGTEKNPYVEALYRRLRAYLKKKQRLERVQQQFEGPDREKLNPDQMLLLKNKDQVLYPLKELEELSRQFSGLMVQTEAQLEAQRLEQTLAAQKIQQNAVQEALNEGKERVRVLVKFLKHASVTRHAPTNFAAYNASVEKVLQMVYEADENSLDVVEKLYSGSDDPIGEYKEVTYRYMKEQMDRQDVCMYTLGTGETAGTMSSGMSSNREGVSEGAVTTYYSEPMVNDASRPGMRMMADTKWRMPYERINFLNKSEIEEAPPMKETVPVNYTRGPVETLSKAFYNQYPMEGGVFSAPMSHYHEMQGVSSSTWKDSESREPSKTHPRGPESSANLGEQGGAVQKTHADGVREGSVSKSKSRGRGHGQGDYRPRSTMYTRGNDSYGRGRRGKRESYEKKDS